MPATHALLALLLLYVRAARGAPPVQRQGFVGDECTVGSECVPPRICIDPNVTPRDACSIQSSVCFCGHRGSRDNLCTCANPCPPGERCVRTPSGDNVCVSRAVPGLDLACSEPLSPDLGAFNFEDCASDADCAVAHSCVTRLLDGFEAPCRIPAEEDCFCIGDDKVHNECSCQYLACQPGEKCSTRDGAMACVSIALNEADLVCNFTTPPPPRPISATKFTDEPCVTSDDCAGPRKCISQIGDAPVTCVGEQNERGCLCQPDDYKDHICTCTTQDCLDGDVCSFLLAVHSPICVSELIGHALICDDEDGEIPTKAPDEIASSPDPDRKKFSFEYCRTDDECAGGRTCIDYDGNECDGTSKCACQPRKNPYKSCSCKNRKCPKGDICGFREEYVACHSVNTTTHPNRCAPTVQPTVTGAIFASPDATTEAAQDASSADANEAEAAASPQPGATDGVCVDARALAHLDSKDLVFQQHALSRVLCDRFGSCATPGHMVRYMGSAMMMSRYCKGVGCVERVMEVNSPRYRRGMRVGSRTDGLEYTAFAARYGTRGEEVVLAAAVRVGL